MFKRTGTTTGNDMEDNARVLLLNRFQLAKVGDESSTKCRIAPNSQQDEDEEDDLENDLLSELASDVEEVSAEVAEPVGDDDLLSEEESEE